MPKPIDGLWRLRSIEVKRHNNHDKTSQIYPGIVCVESGHCATIHWGLSNGLVIWLTLPFIFKPTRLFWHPNWVHIALGVSSRPSHLAPFFRKGDLVNSTSSLTPPRLSRRALLLHRLISISPRSVRPLPSGVRSQHFYGAYPCRLESEVSIFMAPPRGGLS